MIGEHTLPAVDCNVILFYMYICFTCTFVLHVHLFYMYICFTCTFVLHVHLFLDLINSSIFSLTQFNEER